LTLEGTIYLGKIKTKNTLKRINELIKDMPRDPFDGIGKPEALKGNLSGFYSRRINSEHPLVYTVDGLRST
jgi:addiction module toxin, txe/yoeB family